MTDWTWPANHPAHGPHSQEAVCDGFEFREPETALLLDQVLERAEAALH